MTFTTENYTIETIAEYDDPFTQLEIECKGYFYGLIVKLVSGRTYQINFYDPIRLKQDIDSEFDANSIFFFEENLVIISRINFELIKSAIEELFKRHSFDKMICLEKQFIT